MKNCKHLNCLVYHGDIPCNCFTTPYCEVCKSEINLEDPTKQILEIEECKHQFFEISKLKEQFDIDDDPWIVGVFIMCALCGERKHLHADGRVEILDKK